MTHQDITAFILQLIMYIWLTIVRSVNKMLIFKIGMMLAMGQKYPDTYMVSGYKLTCCMGSPEFMSLSSLRMYVNCDAGKIHKGLVIPQMSVKEQKESSSRGRYMYFSSFCEGKYIMYIILRHLQDDTWYNFTCNKMMRHNIYLLILNITVWDNKWI